MMMMGAETAYDGLLPTALYVKGRVEIGRARVGFLVGEIYIPPLVAVAKMRLNPDDDG